MKDKLLVGSDEIVLRVSSDAILAAEVRIPPGGGPPALHRHDPDEVYRVEHGTLTLYTEAGGQELGPGDVAHIPGGQPHTGAPMERFFRAAAALEPGGDVFALAARHGMEIMSPP